LTGSAFSAANTTVVEVGRQIAADTGAVGDPGWADAFARSADHAAGAFSAAGSAVIWVTGGIDAGARTGGLSSGAVEDAFTAGTQLTGSTFSAANTTVVEVGRQIATDTRAIGQTGWAGAFATCADHAAGAFSGAGSAVIWVTGGIDAGARTGGLSSGAVEDAFAVGAELT
jgi:hypothetical protein